MMTLCSCIILMSPIPAEQLPTIFIQNAAVQESAVTERPAAITSDKIEAADIQISRHTYSCSDAVFFFPPYTGKSLNDLGKWTL